MVNLEAMMTKKGLVVYDVFAELHMEVPRSCSRSWVDMPGWTTSNDGEALARKCYLLKRAIIG